MDDSQHTRWKALEKYLKIQEWDMSEILIHFDEDEASTRIGIASCDEFLALVEPIWGDKVEEVDDEYDPEQEDFGEKIETEDDTEEREKTVAKMDKWKEHRPRLTLRTYLDDPVCQAHTLLASTLGKSMFWVDGDIDENNLGTDKIYKF